MRRMEQGQHQHREEEPEECTGARERLFFQRADMKRGILHWVKTLGSATCQGTIVLFLAFVMCQRCLGFVSMSRCLRGELVEVEVGHDVELLCRDNRATDMLWTYTPLGNGSLQSVGNCTKEKQDWQCQVDNEYYQLTALNVYGTLLIIPANSPSMLAGTVNCTGLTRAGDELVQTYSAACLLRVVYPPHQVSRCQLRWNSSDWTVYGSCHVQRTNVSQDRFHCAWLHAPAEGGNFWIQHVTQPRRIGNESMDEHSVRCSLRGYQLTQGNSSGSIQLWLYHQRYWIFAVSIPIQPPGKPRLTSCSQQLFEGVHLTCTCKPSSSAPGSPLPVLTWNYSGPPNNRLQIQHVNRSLDGTFHTCFQKWGRWNSNSVTFILTVYYPPQKPTILNTKNGRLYVQADRPVVITCQAQGGNPTLQADSINMSCDGVHTGPPVTPVQRGGVWISRATFIPRFPTHNGVTCWCRVSTVAPRSHTFRKDTWAILVVESQSTPTTEASSARTTGTDKDSDGKDDGDDDSESEVSLAAIVGVAVGGASVVVIAALIVIIVIRKGQLTYAKSLPEGRDNAHSYTELETYEPVRSPAFYGREIRAGIAQSSAYENTDACRQLAARDDIYEINQIRASNSQQNTIHNMYEDTITDGQEATIDDIYENRITIQHLYQNRVSIGQGSEPEEIYENIEREQQQAVSGEMIYDNWAVGAGLAPPNTLYGNTSAQ